MKLHRLARTAALAALLVAPTASSATPETPTNEGMTPMAQNPEPWRTLSGRIRNLEESMRRVNNASAFTGTGMHPTADNGIESDAFDGDVDAFDPGSKGWSLDDETAMFGSLVLRDGIVGNQALASPVQPVLVHDDASGFDATTTFTTKLSVSVTVPAGFTSLMVTSFTVGVTMANSTAATDYLYISPGIVGHVINGFVLGSSDTAPGITAVTQENAGALLTGLTPGSTVTFVGSVRTAFGSWTGGTGVANLTASGLWLRG